MNSNNNNNNNSLDSIINGRKIIDSDIEDTEEEDKVIEESPNGRWSKLAKQICIQKLIDFDSANLGVDTDRGQEIAWNEMSFNKSLSKIYLNRFDCVETLSNICDKLKFVLKFLIQLDHPNILKFYDFWFINNANEAKLVVITEYTAGGSLKKVLDSSKMSKSIIKPNTYKRWLNQILYSIKYLHSKKLSIFQGHLNSETIFIQNNGVIKLAPTLLSLNSICELNNSFLICTIRNEMNKKSNIDLIRTNNDIIIKDIRAIGRLALEIFTAHGRRLYKSSASPSPRKLSITGPSLCTNKHSSFHMLSNMILNDNENDDYFLLDPLPYLECLDNELQKDFVRKCFYIDESSNVSIDSIWLHPFVNTIESLKVLSVFSIFNYFQNKRSAKIKLNSNKDDKNDNPISTKNIMNHYNLKSIDLEMDELFKKENYLSSSLFLNNSNNNKQTSPNIVTHRMAKSSSCNHLKSYSDRRVSLSFLANFNHLNIPQHFFGIIEDIRSGLYPRLLKENFLMQQDLTRDIQLSSSCLDIVLQMIDKHSPGNNSLSSTLINDQNNNTINEERRLTWNDCYLKNNFETDSKAIQLNLSLKFNDNLCRLLQCYIPNEIIDYIKFDLENNYNIDQVINLNENSRINKICKGLTCELINYGLINVKDNDSIVCLLMNSIKKYILDYY